MPEHQQTQQSKDSNSTFQKQATPTKQTPISNPYSIIQRAKINPKSLTHADVMQLQRTIGNSAVGRLLSEIGLIPSKAEQASPVQMQTIPEEEKEPLQGKMTEPIQRQEIPEEEEPLQGIFGKELEEETCPSCMQRQEIPENEEPLQGKFESKTEQETCFSCSALPIQQIKENRTGMPDNLKAGVENLSGIDMSDVEVHYNSDKPAEVGALAYTQGTDIHVAPGQERHLPHEAWHVVQQMQERVQPTIQMKEDVMLNDDAKLEHEADVMGTKATTTANAQEPKLNLSSPNYSLHSSPETGRQCTCPACQAKKLKKIAIKPIQLVIQKIDDMECNCTISYENKEVTEKGINSTDDAQFVENTLRSWIPLSEYLRTKGVPEETDQYYKCAEPRALASAINAFSLKKLPKNKKQARNVDINITDAIRKKPYTDKKTGNVEPVGTLVKRCNKCNKWIPNNKLIFK